MPAPQLELWSAELHPPAPVYQQLPVEARRHLVRHLAQLILNLVQTPATPHPVSPEGTDHEREPKDP